VHEEDLSIFDLSVVDEEEESEDPSSGESIEHALYSESCNPEPGWALELAGVDLAVSCSTLSSPATVARGLGNGARWWYAAARLSRWRCGEAVVAIAATLLAGVGGDDVVAVQGGIRFEAPQIGAGRKILRGQLKPGLRSRATF
jgi:hypothetical protein